MPELTDVIPDEDITVEWGNAIRDRTVQRYTNTADRSAEHPSPSPGDLAYMEDSGDLYVYHSGSWRLIAGHQEVDNDAVVTGPVSSSSSFVDIASLNLNIPSHWGSWKCEAWASYVINGGTNDVYQSRLRIDGTDQQAKVVALIASGENLDGAVGGRRTGMTTTGSRSVSLRIRHTSVTSVGIKDVYLYARAVRTS